MKLNLLFSLLLMAVGYAQSVTIPSYFVIDNNLSRELNSIITELDLNKDFNAGEDGLEQLSLAVIDLNKEKPHFGGVHFDNFIYPASVYKMYVAVKVLNQISLGKYSLTTPVFVKSPNDVDKSKEIKSDPRPLLRDGDTVTVNYLLDLMITRSDNSAANCLIDLAKRENINAMMHAYGWFGSEVTRKFLSRKFEDPGYEKIRGTETCALHAADFLYQIETNQLINPWVSLQMKILLGSQLDNSRLVTGLPEGAMFYHKTGWFSYWTHDAGIVDDGKSKYITACFLPLPEEYASSKFGELARKIDLLIKNRNKN